MGDESWSGAKDEILVQLSQKGNKEAFEQLVLNYQDKIFSVIFRFVKDYDTVRDLAQDSFIKAYKSIGGFKGKSSFYTWLYQIAVHTALNHLSLASVRTTRGFKDDEMENNLPDTNKGCGNWIEEGYIASETARSTLAAIEELPTDYKKVIFLKEYEDLSYEEIALTLDIPIGTVRSRLNRARKELKKHIKF